jgi:glycosyltransferase involved in cell wall biosynthesis
LLCLRPAGEPSTSEPLQHASAFLEEVELEERPHRRLRLLSSVLVRGEPMQVFDWSSHAYAARVAETVASFEPDIVHVEPRAMAQYLPYIDDSPAGCVLVEHEPVRQTARGIARQSAGLENVVRRLDSLAWARFERASTRRLDAIVALTDEDRRAIEPLAQGRPVFPIPLGVEIPPARFDPVGASPPSLLFVGGYGHPPNVDAALRLARSILPRVHERFPEVVLHLVGDRPPGEVLALAGEHVVVTGRVPDVAPFLQRAAVAVAPLRLGGGMRNKVLEALAAGKAVVASPLATAGLQVTDGDQLLLAEQDAEFASAIVRLLEEPARRRELGAHARAWAETNLGWEERVDAFEAVYRALVAEGHRR